MPARTSVATTITVVATLLSGVVATAATVHGSSRSTEQPTAAAAAPAGVDGAALDPAAPDGFAMSGPEPEAAPSAERGSADPKVRFLLALSRSQSTAARFPASTNPAGTGQPGDAGDAGKSTTKRDGPAPAPTTSPPTTKPAPASTTTTAPPAFNCSGSDDGMSETYKHARGMVSRSWIPPLSPFSPPSHPNRRDRSSHPARSRPFGARARDRQRRAGCSPRASPPRPRS